jgi:hypothetical protein
MNELEVYLQKTHGIRNLKPETVLRDSLDSVDLLILLNELNLIENTGESINIEDIETYFHLQEILEQCSQ